jgi:hypothetical protein
MQLALREGTVQFDGDNNPFLRYKTEVKYIEGQVVEEGTIVSGKMKETKHLAASLIS